MLLPETELYELLQVQRRRLIRWLREKKQGTLDRVMQHVLRESTSGSAGEKAADSNLISSANRWAKISNERSIGRFAVSSVRTWCRISLSYSLYALVHHSEVHLYHSTTRMLRKRVH